MLNVKIITNIKITSTHKKITSLGINTISIDAITRFVKFGFPVITYYSSAAIWKALLFRIIRYLTLRAEFVTFGPLTRGEFDQTKVYAPNIEIRKTSANARARFFGFGDFEVPGVAERTSTRNALFANRSSSSFVYSHRMLPAVREYNASRVTWPCGFVEMFFRALQCNARWLPRYRTSNVEFSNAPVRCLRVETADNFGKKSIQNC